jgi:hypothetical protein
VVYLPGFFLLGSTAARAEGPVITIQPATFDPAVPASRTHIILSAQPGQVLQAAVSVQNIGSTPGAVRLYPVDATTEQASGQVYRTESDARMDIGAWAAIDAQAITLQAGESRSIPFTITVPTTPRPGQHLGGIAAEDTTIRADEQPGGAIVSFRTVTIVSVEVDIPGPLIEKVMVTKVTPGVISGKQVLALGMGNEGTTSVMPSGTVTIKSAQGLNLRDIRVELRSVLPDTAINYPVAVPTQPLPAGDYYAIVALKYGQSGETQSTLRFTITPAQASALPPTAQPQVASSLARSAAVSNTSLQLLIPWILLALGGVGVLLVILPLCTFMLGRSRRR